MLNDNYLSSGISILDFSPSRSYYHKLKNNSTIDYHSSDLSDNFIAEYKYDITNIDCEDSKFDLIICYHILEHITDDNKAINELYRILKNECFCLIQTPFKEGDIYEDANIIKGEDRLEHFGQEDHVRVYSIEGLKDRLTDNGFNVEIKSFNEDTNNYFGYSEKEYVLICDK